MKALNIHAKQLFFTVLIVNDFNNNKGVANSEVFRKGRNV